MRAKTISMLLLGSILLGPLCADSSGPSGDLRRDASALAAAVASTPGPGDIADVATGRYTNATLPSARVASERFEAVSERWFARLAGLREPEVFGRVSRQKWDAELLHRLVEAVAER